MVATLTASPGALVLTLDDPARDDLDSVIVWASTTSGFTPSAANVVYEGKSLNVTIPNLTPSTTYYVKYAYVSAIDVDDYVISSQLSGVPSKIDGSLIGDGAIGGANFASTIKPIEIVSTLPSTGNTQGRTVFLTTDSKLYRYNGTAFVSTVPASDLTGQLVASQIADAAVTTAKFAAGIEPIEIVAALPSTGNFQGRTVFLTTDSKLYRYNGTSFVSTVPASDLTGQIGTTQITDDAITTAKLAANSVTANELAANSVIAGKVAAAAISTTELAAGAVTAAKIAAGTITANELAANSITGEKIAADTITAANLAANCVTANELAANSVIAGKIAAAAVSTTELAASAITADKIEANALRGKTLSGGVVIDGGTVATAAVAKPANVTVTTTVNVQNTDDFHDFGAAIVLSKNARFRDERQFRYTGKTATSLTGVSGLQYSIEAGDIIVPQPFPSFTLDSYTVGSAINTSNGANFLFRNGGGTALAINGSRVTQAFTYTAGQTYSGGVYTSVLTGVSGLSAFAAGQGSRATIVDVYYLAYTTISTTGSYSSLTINAPIDYLKSGGGKFLLVSWNVSGVRSVGYSAYSGTTVTLDGSYTLPAGTYWLLPIYSFNVVGSDLYSIVSYNNALNGQWQKSFLSSDQNVAQSEITNLEIKPSSGSGLIVTPSGKASELDTAGVFIGRSGVSLHLEMEPIPFSEIDDNYMYGVSYGNMVLGAATGFASHLNPDGTYTKVLVAFDGYNKNQYQPISTTVRFNGYNTTNLDGIVFDDTTDVFSFWADGVAGKGSLSARTITLTQPSEQYPTNISIPKTSHATSKRCGVSIGDFLIGEDTWGDGTRDFFIYDWVAGGIRFVVASTGNIGIGTRTPTWPLTVNGDIRTEGSGNILATGTGQVGYGAGAGGTVTQTGSRSTAVTLNKATGRITMVFANGTATTTTFTVNNSIVNANDSVIVNQRTGSNKYVVFVTGIAAGSFDVSFYSSSGTAADSLQIAFTVIKGQTA